MQLANASADEPGVKLPVEFKKPQAMLTATGLTWVTLTDSEQVALHCEGIVQAMWRLPVTEVAEELTEKLSVGSEPGGGGVFVWLNVPYIPSGSETLHVRLGQFIGWLLVRFVQLAYTSAAPPGEKLPVELM